MAIQSTPQRPKHLKKLQEFPNIKKSNNEVKSDEDTFYNCIAFAAGVKNKKFWPGFHPDYKWPPNLPITETVDSFIRFYGTYGYAICDDGSYEVGFQKIAIFAAENGLPKHASIQIGPGKWASKLGDWYDIEHTRDAVSGGSYGEIVQYMKKPI